MEAMPVLFTIITMGQATNDNKDKNNGPFFAPINGTCFNAVYGEVMVGEIPTGMINRKGKVEDLWRIEDRSSSSTSLFIRSLWEGGISKGAVRLPDVDHPVGWDKGVEVIAHGVMVGIAKEPDVVKGVGVIAHGVMVGIAKEPDLEVDVDNEVGFPENEDNEKNEGHDNTTTMMKYGEDCNIVNLMLKDVNRKSSCDDPNMMLPGEKLDALCQEDNEDSLPNEDLLMEVVLGALGVRDGVPGLFNDLIPVPVPVVAVRDGGDVPGGGEEEDHAEGDVEHLQSNKVRVLLRPECVIFCRRAVTRPLSEVCIPTATNGSNNKEENGYIGPVTLNGFEMNPVTLNGFKMNPVILNGCEVVPVTMGGVHAKCGMGIGVRMTMIDYDKDMIYDQWKKKMMNYN